MKKCALLSPRIFPKVMILLVWSLVWVHVLRRDGFLPRALAFSESLGTKRIREASVLWMSKGSPSKDSSKKPPNVEVRTIMATLKDRYEPSDAVISTAEWKKTRNYLYHASRTYNNTTTKRGGDHTLTKQVEEVLDFLDVTLLLPQKVSRKVLQEAPRILRKPVSSFLTPTADFLLQLWGPDLFVQAVERNPALLLTSGVGYTTNRKTSTNTRRNQADPQSSGALKGDSFETTSGGVEEILQEYTDLSSAAMQRMKRAAPFVFGLEPSKVDSVLGFLQTILQQKLESVSTKPSAEEDGRPDPEDSTKVKKMLGKIIVAHPNLLNLSVESNLKPRVDFLKDRCSLSPSEMARVVQTSNGSVLGLSVENNLKPTMDYLIEDLFVGEDAESESSRKMLKKCVLSHPQLLGLSLPNLQAKVDYFDTWGPSLARRVATKCPAIYSLNLQQNIKPSINFLGKVWGWNKGNISRDAFVSMLQEYPNVITLSVETNLQPTMMFFNKTGYTLLDEDWDLVPSNAFANRTNGMSVLSSRIRGRHIAASLYNRLLPRWHFCLTIHKDSAQDTVVGAASITNPLTETLAPASALPITPPLHLLIMASDEIFCQTMGFELEAFATFKADAIPRLKFSSQFDTWLKTGKPIDL